MRTENGEIAVSQLFDAAASFYQSLGRLGACKQEIAWCAQRSRDLGAVLNRVREVLNDELLVQSAPLPALLDRLESNLSSGEQYLPPSEALALMDSCDELRFRILAVALGISAKDHIKQAANEAQAESSPIIRGPGGITYARLGNNLVLLLPRFESRETQEAAMRGLLSIFDSPWGQRLNWLIDFSSVAHAPPVLFWGVLKTLKKDLERCARAMALTWLRQGLFPPRLGAKLIAEFKLKPIGGHFFSSPAELAGQRAGNFQHSKALFFSAH